ncbi:hypothetical protein IWW54_002943 [Coemansia sp. RSA 2705]|nr:hypothetical protein IWW54_002943 [Coemansia sp. RSA 2705]
MGNFGRDILKILRDDMRSDTGIIGSLDLVTFPKPKRDKNSVDVKKSSSRGKKKKKKKKGALGDDSALNEHIVDAAINMQLPVSYIGRRARPAAAAGQGTSQHVGGDPAAPHDIAIVCMSPSSVPELGQLRLGALKVHPSLLPKYRGPTPIQTAIMDDAPSTGVSVIEFYHTGEHGNILAQYPYALDSQSTLMGVQAALALLGGNLLLKVLGNLEHVRKHSVRQDRAQATYTEQACIENTRIVWESMTAAEIYKRHRAYCGTAHMSAVWRRKHIMHTVLLLDMYLPDPDTPVLSEHYDDRPPGTVFFRRKSKYLEIPCIDGSRIHVTKLRVIGRTEKDAQGFVNGYLRVNGALRMLTAPVKPKVPTPPFVYPPGHPKEGVVHTYVNQDFAF